MKVRCFLLVLAALPLVGTAVFGETVEEILKRHAEIKVTDLEAYLEAQPKAADRAEAIQALVETKMQLGRAAETLPLLFERYDALIAADEKDISQLMGQAIFPIISICVSDGKVDEGKAFVERVKKDLEGIENYDRIVVSIERMADRFNLPSKGQTLEIAFKGIDGKAYNLADMKGKTVLVDFWATWCGPCLREIPAVKKAYAKYNEKGFEVIGISLDRGLEPLEKFVAKEQITWPQCLDSQDGHGFAEKYGIRSIPSTFLIGADGTIVATELRGDDLEQKLAKIFPDA